MSRIKKKYIRFGTGTQDVNAQDVPANYTPVNYTPVQVGTEGTDKTSAHLKGIDAALTGASAPSSATIANNQTSAADVTGALFNPITVAGVEITYSINRKTLTTEVATVGTIYLSYVTAALDWQISNDSTSSNAGITFDITALGQLTYTSTNISGTGYVGTIKYTAKTFPV